MPHPGAFFQEEKEADATAGVTRGVAREQIFNRDFGHAVGEDKYDKTLLPKVLQAKHPMRAARWVRSVG